MQDYQNINKWTVQNQCTLPLIMTLIQDLGGASIYAKWDVCWGYNNVHIQKGNKHKAAFKMQCGLYEPTVMCIGFTNSPATFQAMINSLYHDTIVKHKVQGTNICIYMNNFAIATK